MERFESGGIPESTVHLERRSRGAGDLPRDGRYIDPGSGALDGEAAGQRVREREASPGLPAQEERDPEDPTYYGLPVLKQPVWIWTIPAYFHVGGVAGAAGVLGSLVELAGREDLRPLARRCHRIAFAGTSLGSVLLIADLGRPERFLAMLRVFRPTSPMSVGSWILAADGAATFASVVLPQGLLQRTAGILAGPLGAVQAGYTAVLLNCTAVEVWRGTRRSLPWLFAGSSMAGLGAFLDLFDLDERSRQVVDRYARVGKVVELAAGVAAELEAAAEGERVVRPLRTGLSGAVWQASRICTAASLALSLLPGESPRRRRLSGVLGTLGALGVRFATLFAGRSSARDPRATFHRQRKDRAAAAPPP